MHGTRGINLTDAGRKTILVADDTEDIAAVVATVLRLSGCNAVTARDGLEAVDMAVKCRPDMIFMDIQMPVMDGLEATRRILAIPDLSNTTIIATSSNCKDEGWQTRALDAGCLDCVQKQINLDTLKKLIYQFIGGCELDAA